MYKRFKYYRRETIENALTTIEERKINFRFFVVSFDTIVMENIIDHERGITSKWEKLRIMWNWFWDIA